MKPLNLRSQVFQDAARFLRNGHDLLGGYVSHAGDIAFDYVFRHGDLSGKTDRGDPTGSLEQQILGFEAKNSHGFVGRVYWEK
jgi:hypothetical protein